MERSTYKKVALDEVETAYSPRSPDFTPTPTASHHSDRQSIQFAKAAFVFKDHLDGIRQKHTVSGPPTPSAAPPSQPATPASTQSSPAAARAPTPPPAPAADDDDAPAGPAPEPPAIARRLRLLRLGQSTLTAGLSIAVAALQLRAYTDFQRTKNVPGAWPTQPNLLATVLLFIVALAAATFDLALLGAYLLPRRAARLLSLAAAAHTTLTTVKGLSYALTSVVCRGGFDFGNSSGQNQDLWSWTCSPQGDAMAAVNNAEANCAGQTAAWYIAMAQVAIEALGTVGSTLIKQNTKKKTAAREKAARDAEFDVEFAKVADLQADFDDSLSELVPTVEKKPGK